MDFPFRQLFLLCMSGAMLMQLSFSQTIRPGEWRTYLSHNNSVQSAVQNGVVYTITGGGMFSYDTSSKEVNTFSTVEGLAGINPSTIYHDPRTNTVYIGYADGKINFFNDPTDIKTITDINRNDFYTAKGIKDFASDDQFLYVATEFGMVVFNLDNRLPEFTVTQIDDNPSRLPIGSVSLYNDQIWIAMEKGDLYSAPAGFPNLSDPNIWLLENGNNGLPAGEFVFEAKGNSNALYARLANAVWIFQDDQWKPYELMAERFDRIYVQENAIAGSQINRTLVINADGPQYNFFVEGAVNYAVMVGVDEFYVGKRFTGMDRFKNWEIDQVIPGGPRTNFSTEVAAYDGEVYIAPRGYGSSFVPEPDGSGVYYFNPDQGWKTLTSQSGDLPSRVNTGFARAFIDRRTKQAFVGSFGKGLLELEQGVVSNFYDCANSTLSTVSGICDTTKFDETRISGIDMDLEGNLWVSMTFAQNPLAMRTPEGEWFVAPGNRFPANAKFIDMIADDLGSKWLINEDRGIVVYRDNGTPTNFQDDRVLNLNPIRTDLDGSCDPTNEVLSIAKDRDGFIWAGTNKGVIVYYDPFSISQGQAVNASRPVFNGRCLLENENVYSIAVDGANRKWFATDNGAFLMNEDGTEQIDHFTTRNSPLLDDKINHIAVDPITGEVFFSTDKGIISYGGDATEGDAICEEVFVYPNPYFTDMSGDIVIRGTAPDSKVKITTVSGRLVKEIRSQGGTTLWDGRDLQGQKVHSGIYLVLVANDDGLNPCIGKFAVVRR